MEPVIPIAVQDIWMEAVLMLTGASMQTRAALQETQMPEAIAPYLYGMAVICLIPQEETQAAGLQEIEGKAESP